MLQRNLIDFLAARMSMRSRRLASILGPLLGCLIMLFAFITWPFISTGKPIPDDYNWAVVVCDVAGLGVVSAIIGGLVDEVLTRRQRIAAQQRAARIAKNQATLEKLASGHTELVTLLTIMREDQKEQDEQRASAERLSFRRSLIWNFVFFCLGIIIPLLLGTFHAGKP